MSVEVAKKRPATGGKSHAPHKKPKFDGKPGSFKPKPTGKYTTTPEDCVSVLVFNSVFVVFF